MPLAELADRVARDDAASAPASLWVVLGAAALAVVLAALLGRIGHSARTIHHEAGHALVVALVGGTVLGLRAHRRGGGVTTFVGVTWLGDILVSLAGYLAPSAFGLLAAAVVTAGHPKAALVLTLVLLGLVLLVSSGLYTFVIVVGTGLLLCLVVRYAGAGGQMLAGLTWSWFLLIGGVIDAVTLTQLRRSASDRGERDTSSDAASLRRLTLLPAALWSGLFVAASLIALVLGGSLLLGIAL